MRVKPASGLGHFRNYSSKLTTRLLWNVICRLYTNLHRLTHEASCIRAQFLTICIRVMLAWHDHNRQLVLAFLDNLRKGNVSRALKYMIKSPDDSSCRGNNGIIAAAQDRIHTRKNSPALALAAHVSFNPYDVTSTIPDQRNNRIDKARPNQFILITASAIPYWKKLSVPVIREYMVAAKLARPDEDDPFK